MWLCLPDMLKGLHSLETFSLHGNQVNDNGRDDMIVAREVNGKVVASFAQLVINSTSLCELDFGGNVDVGDELAIEFANTLKENHTLTILGFDPIYHYDETTQERSYSDKITHVGWNAIKIALCNGSSIEETYKSNHILEKVGTGRKWRQRTQKEKLPTDLLDILELNASYLSKNEVARKKILMTHFHDKHSKVMKLFEEDMDLQVIPHAITWFARDDDDDMLGQTALYWMLHSLPLSPSSSEKKSLVAKRKRGD